MYFHETFLIDTLTWILGTIAGLVIGYLILKTYFKIQDHQARASHQESNQTWATLQIFENRRGYIMTQWFTHQITTEHRDLLLNAISKTHQEAEANWIEAGKK